MSACYSSRDVSHFPPLTDLTETALRFDKALRYLADQSTLAFAYREAAVATSLVSLPFRLSLVFY